MIPVPKLLIKDHKKKKEGNFPTQLIIPATNFISGFTNLGCKGIKNIFDENKINYAKITII